MIISAFGDLDRCDIQALENAVKHANKPDLLLFAGDIAYMMDSDQTKKYEQVIKILDQAGWDCPIIAVFGNHDAGGQEEEIVKKFQGRIFFLRDQAVSVSVREKTVGIVGSIGVLDTTTMWESGGVVGMMDQFGERIEKLNKLLKNLKDDFKILLTHYAPTYKTLEGEPEDLWEVMGSEIIETIVKQRKPNICIHGHAHFGKALAFINGIPVFNVALPVNNNRIVEIDTDNLPSE